MHILINKNYLTYNKLKVKCAIGKKGIGNKKKEGDLITPIGVFKIKYILYRKDRVKVLTKLKKKVIKKNMGWCDDPNSSYYNKLVKLPFTHKHEKLYKKENIYDIILVLNYNMNPVKKNKGSALFIHVSKINYKKTEGCVAIKKINLIKLLRMINPNTRVKISHRK
ncbi:MAG: transpeptidase [Pelagibacteraceae bacterium]|nr:transpeptidase [Pelagibacteraceae bacterium]|tara:strand:+ start:4411 stop:4908 length:498 start_codon:yes stop_codon:yes gene_type:complete